MTEGYVIKVTGKIFEPENSSLLVAFADTLMKYREKYRFIVVCGGGKTLRYWLNILRRESSVSEYELDLLGISFTRLNAELLIKLLYPYSIDNIPKSIEAVIQLVEASNKIIVLGGLSPGFSTNAVAAFIAKELGYTLLNITSAGGVYDKDPLKYPDAKKLDEVVIDDLIKLLNRESETAGNYPLFDMTSLNIIKEYKIPTYVISTDVKDLKAILEGGVAGTKIVFQ